MNSDNDVLPYSDYYVAYLDILGFKDLVKSKEHKDRKKIYEYFKLIEEITSDLKKIESQKDIGAIIISDSVILSVPFGAEEDENIDKLRKLCIAIQKIQFKLAEIDIWLRGAISSGEAYFDSKKNQIVGPAYINAYLLEERLAINPRVILDNKLINELKLDSAQMLIDKVNNVETCLQEYDALERNILFQWTEGGIQKIGLKKDVALFIDYLVYAFDEESRLMTIVENIEYRIYSDNSIYPKFRWVTDYLIASCQFHNNHRPCKIASELLIEQHNRLQKL
jgi:hypothetical protein